MEKRTWDLSGRRPEFIYHELSLSEGKGWASSEEELCLPLWQKLSTFCCIEAIGEFREEEEEEEAGGKRRRWKEDSEEQLFILWAC